MMETGGPPWESPVSPASGSSFLRNMAILHGYSRKGENYLKRSCIFFNFPTHSGRFPLDSV